MIQIRPGGFMIRLRLKHRFIPSRLGRNIAAVLAKLEKGKMADLSFLAPQTRGNLILGYQEELAAVKLR